MNRNILSLLFLSIGLSLSAQSSWYVSTENGSNNNNGTSPNTPVKTAEYLSDNNLVGPGDTVYLMGTITNEDYQPNYEFSGNINDPYIWKTGHSFRMTAMNGTPDAYITITAYDENTIIKGDGANLFRMLNCSYVRIVGLEMEGKVNDISLETALALQFVYRIGDSQNSMYRVESGTAPEQVENMTFPALSNTKRPSYTDTRGIYLSNVHHIDLIDNYIHHVPGNGFRVATCDYINIIGNEVHDTSRKSYSGTHGLVVTNATSFDNETDYKIFIQRNKIHHNYNEIYSWAPTKTIITPKIDEGKGISLQRNGEDTGWTHGRILVSDNLTYWNGFSGVHSNTGIRIDFINNTAFQNSYTGSITDADNPSGANIGISLQSTDDAKILNNISVIDGTWGGFALSEMNSTNLEVANNMVFSVSGELLSDPTLANIETGTIVADPLFVSSSDFNFALQENSPAIGAANPVTATMTDFDNALRDEHPDLGALERGEWTVNLKDINNASSLHLFPNPTEDILTIQTKVTLDEISIFDMQGRERSNYTGTEYHNETVLNLSHLPIGYYYIRIRNIVKAVIKIK